MEYGRYLDRFTEDNPDINDVKICIKVRTEDQNKDWPGQHANQLELKIIDAIENDWFGVRYVRTGLVFAIRACACSNRPEHLEPFNRFLNYFNTDFYEKVEMPKGLLR